MARVRLEAVTKSFGDVPVIPSLDLEIADREFVVLVGPSGCGKTTTLRMIAGLEAATGGTIRIGDRDVTQLRPGLRNCAMVFQNYALYPHMTVRENIGYGMKVRGEPKAAIDGKIKEAARVLGLEPYLDRRPKQLSGGQRQRVAIGRAIVRDPDVFLFDEPLSNLDAKLRIEMRAEIKALHRRLQTTIVYVTHDQVEAMTMADRVVVMNQGRIEQAAEPLTLYERPANLFVAAFIGAPSMNFLPATVVAGGTPGLRLEDGTVLPAPAGKRAALAGREGLAVTIGLRPEHVAGGGAGPVTLPILPRVIEPLGAHTLILGEVAGARFTAQVDAHFPARPDEPTTISLDPDRLHLFETAGGSAL
ncbi:ABC transporter ATP-binding protein [Inquilinus limosus]|uniref:Sugar ABC transporter ATP-binding protein n=1 Tax=Inquilinus limosus TaxID=171674 RepID=A0A211Z3T7_9PROT|nr:sn-glycerol-3-phosphate ABC transporter ATP-binding protein UgpC [Inquilinus limosus]OWJ59883.1 sugar ABC transporter ATP-binding protein [Inquilinus limosus]